MKRPILLVGLAFLAALAEASATREDSIENQIASLRKLKDSDRAILTKELALKIRARPLSSNRLSLAGSLANLATEGDFGRDTLQEVTTTLAESLEGITLAPTAQGPDYTYIQLAQLERYEHMKVKLDQPGYKEALKYLEKLDSVRSKVDFTLNDITGKSWKLSSLKGKVVLVNFWATWCPPCRKEMPDIEALYKQFQSKGLVVLAISDETLDKVKPFITDHHYSYPVLLDPGRKVNNAYKVDGIPKNFVYNRQGKLVAQSIDMRTKGQFLKMLALAGLK